MSQSIKQRAQRKDGGIVSLKKFVLRSCSASSVVKKFVSALTRGSRRVAEGPCTLRAGRLVRQSYPRCDCSPRHALRRLTEFRQAAACPSDRSPAECFRT